jgi:O-antigen/teichoic acid export membrane protein
LGLAVSRPGALAEALWSYAFVALSSAAVTWLVLAREGLRGVWSPPRWPPMVELMRRASAIVFGNLGGALLTNGGVALLGLTADAATVGAANLALRVKMAGLAALLPLKQLAYVRLSTFAQAQRPRALRVGRVALGSLLVAGAAISMAVYWAAEPIVRIVFLGDHPVAVGLVMLLGLSVPLNAAAELLGMQCLIAFGHERSYAAAVTLAGIVFMAALLWVLHGQLAYGWAVLVAETCLLTLAALRVRAVLSRQP